RTETLARLRESISSVFLGPQLAVDRLLCCLLARGHLLLEDVPGVGKTVLATVAARSLGGTSKRVQMTSDLLPADIIGVSVYEEPTREFRFVPGPVFANVVIADEVNRAPPRTQSALLEAMNDASVTVDGTTHALPKPFLVIATQNPTDHHGAYPLPESQLDRFLMRTSLGYLRPEDEVRVLLENPAAKLLEHLEPVASPEDVAAMQAATDATTLSQPLAEYIRALAVATRSRAELSAGISTRGALAVARVARAAARVNDRDYVTTDDITDHFVSVAAHRLIPVGGFSGMTMPDAEGLASDVLRETPMPL
ncbi:MAG: MoxR family ATPase, partial [Planctomycetota bacterium]